MTQGITVVKRSSAGLGLFATTDIPRGERIIEYIGEHISHEEADLRRGMYLFTLNKEIVIDGKDRKNLARYINHSCRPNAYAEINEEEKKIFFYSKRAIKKNEEISFNYGKTFWREIIEPKGCKCEHCLKKK